MTDTARLIQIVRLAVGGAVAVVTTALLLVVALSISRGESLSSTQLVGLLATVGTLVGIIVNLLGTGAVASVARDTNALAAETRDKVNGHLDAHMALHAAPSGEDGGIGGPTTAM